MKQRKASDIRMRLRRSVKFATPWPLTTLRRWKREGKVFCVYWRHRDLYPAFQFGPCGLPWSRLRKILSIVSKDGWALLSWFEAPNELLDDRKPSRVLQVRSHEVLEAARQFYSVED